ncbi:glycoside hydrolase family 17 protein [Suillus bovinus]|uniref:glycoside hydrolase family 17 protein n=1 Tax=Suillus bovinus TaxID=48563 RepID=UPI001B87F0DD|nr:glycoside hydrolase family 17 protein [Suillus bovinus]KAG2146123.1 glycoside hydrolase family 17 protein [Suillus bovinus]
MQRSGYSSSMQQVAPYRDTPTTYTGSPNLQDNNDPVATHARSPFDSSHDLSSEPTLRNSPTQQPLAGQPTSTVTYMPVPQSGYQNMEPRNSDWLEQTQKASRRSRLIVIGSVTTLIILIAAGIAVGVTLSKKSTNNNSSSSSSSVPAGTNPNDPSNFPKNSALVNSFYGIAYTPLGSQLPDCGNSLTEVIEDIQLLSQLTSTIRLYGSDCNQSSLVLAAIQATKVNMSVYLGNYPDATDNGAAYTRQKGEIQTALQQYGGSNVAGITVGNEFILDYITSQGQTDPNGSAGQAAAAMLVPWINDTRSMLSSMGLSNILVGNADAGSYFNNEVLAAVDYGMANVHPWFANQSIANAAAWTAEFFSTTDVALAQSLPNKPKMFIAETGWPTGSSSFNANPNDGPSLASVENLQIFINDFACQATKNGTGYFFFEYSDEPWKNVTYGGVEGYWGLFDANKNLKNITIPTC